MSWSKVNLGQSQGLALDGVGRVFMQPSTGYQSSAYAWSDTGLTNCAIEQSFVIGTDGAVGGMGYAYSRWSAQAAPTSTGYVSYLVIGGGTANYVWLKRVDGSTATDIATPYQIGAVDIGQTIHVRTECEDTTIRVYVNGTLRLTATDATYSSGSLGIGIQSAPNQTATGGVRISDVVLETTLGSQQPSAPTGQGSDSATGVEGRSLAITGDGVRYVTESGSGAETSAVKRIISPVPATPSFAPTTTAMTLDRFAVMDQSAPPNSGLFPAICKKANGDLLAVVPRMTGHLAGDGRLWTRTGTDNGDGTVTWRNDWTMIRDPGGGASNWDMRSGLPRLIPSGPDAGKVVICGFETEWVTGSVANQSTWPTAITHNYSFVLVSTDASCTAWEERSILPNAIPAGCGNCAECPIVFLPNGDWLATTYSRETMDFIGWYSSPYFRSTDNGHTWTVEGFVGPRANPAEPQDQTYHADEPYFCLLDNGELLCMIRTLEPGNPQGLYHNLWRCQNPTDRGNMVWTRQGHVPSGEAGSRTGLYQCRDGTLVYMFREIVNQSSHCGGYMFSVDRGLTWSAPRDLHSGNAASYSFPPQFSYGDWVQLSNGDVLGIWCDEVPVNGSGYPSIDTGIYTLVGATDPAAHLTRVPSAQTTVWTGGTASTFGGHIAFPSWIQHANGTLRMIARKSSGHGVLDGDIVQKTSTDKGATWSAESTLVGSANDERPGNLSLLPSGRTLFTWYTATPYVPPDNYNYVTPKCIYSDDNGATWSAPATMGTSFDTLSAVPSNVVQAPDGSLICALFGRYSRSSYLWDIRISRSTDEGATWSDYGLVVSQSYFGGVNPVEAQLVVWPDGEILMAFHTEENVGNQKIYFTRSYNSGATWSTPVYVRDGWNRQGLTLSPDGDLILCYTPSNSAQYLVTSWDRGSTWGTPIQISAPPIDGLWGNVWIEPDNCGALGENPNLGVAYSLEDGNQARASVWWKTLSNATAAATGQGGSALDTGAGIDRAVLTIGLGGGGFSETPSLTVRHHLTVTDTYVSPRLYADTPTLNIRHGLSVVDAWHSDTPVGPPPEPVAPAARVTLAEMVPANASEEYLARLGFQSAQRMLRGATDMRTTRAADVGWYGTSVDPERGAFAVVRSDGPLADLVGERVRVSRGAREVYAYVIAETDIQDDLALSRRAYMGLAPLAEEPRSFRIEVVL